MLRFGTDGVRAPADTLIPPFTAALGAAIARATGARTGVAIGFDTRESSERIASEVAAGIQVGGGFTAWWGVQPTPAMALVAADEHMPAVIISASHNPWTDNGIKVVGADGRKLPDAIEAAIERELDTVLAEGIDISRVEIDFLGHGRTGTGYEDHLLGVLEGRSLAGLSVVLDCANGAASAIGPGVLRDAGADVTVINAEPNGRNINDSCGSTHPEALQREVVARGADLGLALDGDADRVLAVDETGALVDGDQIMTMAARYLKDRGDLAHDTLVVTVMSNLGLRHAMRDAGIDLVETPVGDRHVVAAMQEGGYVLGGEQSGHIVFSQYATTGDGLLTGLVVCDIARRYAQPLSQLAAPMTRYPQVLVNVRVGRVDLDHAPALWDAVRRVEHDLGDDGRVLVRASGTEPLVRVMVEAATQEVAERAAAQITAVVEAEFGLA